MLHKLSFAWPSTVSQDGPAASGFGVYRTARMRRTTSLFIGMPNANVICCAMRGHPQVGFRRFMSTTAAITSLVGPFGPGFVCPADENRCRYFLVVSARWKRGSVEGFRTMATRTNRLGRISSAHAPANTRSRNRRRGDRFLERLRINNCCFRSSDSATTARTPPGLASRATVASTCTRRTASSRTGES